MNPEQPEQFDDIGPWLAESGEVGTMSPLKRSLVMRQTLEKHPQNAKRLSRHRENSVDCQIRDLFETPEHIPLVARWIHDGFRADRDVQTPDLLAGLLRLAKESDVIPVSLLAFHHGEPVGTINLIENDDEHRTHLPPWLAALFILPSQPGCGSALVWNLMHRRSVMQIAATASGRVGPGEKYPSVIRGLPGLFFEAAMLSVGLTALKGRCKIGDLSCLALSGLSRLANAIPGALPRAELSWPFRPEGFVAKNHGCQPSRSHDHPTLRPGLMLSHLSSSLRSEPAPGE